MIPVILRTALVELICRGHSKLTISRSLGISVNTVSRFISQAAAVCEHRLHQDAAAAAPIRVECVRIWATPGTRSPEELPDGGVATWAWVAIADESRLVCGFAIGLGDEHHEAVFTSRMEAVLGRRMQWQAHGSQGTLTSSGASAGVDARITDHRAAREIGPTRQVSKLAAIADAMALQFVAHNHVHCSVLYGMTAAMRAGVAANPWTMDALASLIDGGAVPKDRLSR